MKKESLTDIGVGVCRMEAAEHEPEVCERFF